MEKNNKLIAEFMGVDQVDIDYAFNEHGQLKYHLSWDWLMPVIKKCRATEVDKDRELSKQRLIDNINFCLFTLDLLGTHGNIIDFIKWYERKPIVTTF